MGFLARKKSKSLTRLVSRLINRFEPFKGAGDPMKRDETRGRAFSSSPETLALSLKCFHGLAVASDGFHVGSFVTEATPVSRPGLGTRCRCIDLRLPPRIISIDLYDAAK
jgi:hypothetical protein